MVTGESNVVVTDAMATEANGEAVTPESTVAKASPIPDWLNKQFFEDIFVEQEHLERGKFQVKINAITPTGGAGENYTSMLYRANVDAACDDGSSRNLSVIIKAMIATEPALKEMGAFVKERFAYEKLLPKLEQIWRDAGETVRFGPRCWKAIEGDTDILVLDDLCASGYNVLNRQEGADLEHARLFLGKLAKFHAATATEYRKNGPINNLYKDFLVPHIKEFYDQYYDAIRDDFLNSLDKWPEYEQYSAKMRKNMRDIYEKLEIATDKVDSDFVVLCHGDTWTNNHMFNHKQSGAPEDVLLIDFQIPYYGSPVQDLFYYIISSTTLELKTKHFDLLVQHYHQQLSEALRKLEYPGRIPNLRDFHMELLRRGFFGFQCLFSILPVVLADKSDDANIAAFVGDSEKNRKFRHDLYNNPIYQEHLRGLIALFDVRGLLDYDHVVTDDGKNGIDK